MATEVWNIANPNEVRALLSRFIDVYKTSVIAENGKNDGPRAALVGKLYMVGVRLRACGYGGSSEVQALEQIRQRIITQLDPQPESWGMF